MDCGVMVSVVTAIQLTIFTAFVCLLTVSLTQHVQVVSKHTPNVKKLISTVDSSFHRSLEKAFIEAGYGLYKQCISVNMSIPNVSVKI